MDEILEFEIWIWCYGLFGIQLHWGLRSHLVALDQKVKVEPAVVLAFLEIQVPQFHLLRNWDVFVEENKLIFLAYFVEMVFNLAIHFEFHYFG